ncbi:calpain-12-like [Eublepharis macularius]|uniref:Calpain-12-like n=1 Tax=Eublepharis macularius TaxID=481883 RepID=A0AA97KIK1_EUBMA|nr:calpain-12-like [Eublepharis macularius]
MAPPSITVRLTKDPDAKGAAPVIPYCGQSYLDLKRQCLQQGYSYTDPFFKPCPESIGYNELGPGAKATQGLIWKRPKKICRYPKFICEAMSRTDVCQGQLGDCWFLAAAASLTLYPQLMRRVVPQDQSFDGEDYVGIFHFQFWQYGQWVDVVVDDLLPTVNGELLFVRSAENNEFWMPLLEKAYAKLNGSYEAMNGGYMNEAFVDFTGGIGETIPLKTPNPELFRTIKQAVRKRSMMGAHIQVKGLHEREANTAEGLVKGHAYSITGVHKLDVEGKKVKLLRLRNPWGEVEWRGRWSDHSPLWSYLDPALKNKLCVSKEDGEFWMQLVDFVRHFDVLEICHLRADAIQEEGAPSSWNISCFQGCWVKGYTAGGRQTFSPWDTFWMNPQYHVSLREPDEAQLKRQKRKEHQSQGPTCSLLVSLMQKDRRRDRRRGKDFLLICFDIFQVPNQYLQVKSTAQRKKLLPSLRAVSYPVFGYARDITGHLQLPPGDYLVIPSTQNPLEEADFTLRIFTEKEHQFLEIDDEITADEKTLQVMQFAKTGLDPTLERTFLEQAGQDQQVGTAELQHILNKAMASLSHLRTDGFSLKACQKIIQDFSKSGTGRLTLHEFMQLWTKIKEWEGIFIMYDMDRSGTMNSNEMQLALDAAGFHLNNQTTMALVQKCANPWLQTDFDDFISLVVHLEAIFQRCKNRDSNGDGLIYMTQKEWMELVTSPNSEEAT